MRLSGKMSLLVEMFLDLKLDFFKEKTVTKDFISKDLLLSSLFGFVGTDSQSS